MPPKRTFFRRAVLLMASIGLDIRPGARRFRDAVLRNHRAEVAAEFRQMEIRQLAVAADLSHRLAALQVQIAALEQSSVESEAQRAIILGDIRDHLATSDTALAALQRADTDQVENQAQAMLGIQALDSRTTELLHCLTAMGERLSGEEDESRNRIFRLEKLLTHTPCGPLPISQSALACLPKPAVSVILPTYNRSALIGDAVGSVQAQTFSNWELIIIDDGSSEDIAAALAPYLTDHRIRLVRQLRGNAAVARNRGISETGAPLIAYIDSDNLWYPEFLAHAVDCLANDSDIDLVYGALVTEDHNLDRSCILWSSFDRKRLLAGNFVDTNVIVHRRSLVERHGGWDNSLRRLLDWDLLLRYTAEKPARPINVLAALYRSRDEQRISQTIPIGPDEIAIRRKWFPPPLPTRRPRVLYVVWHYPQLSESYIETELLCMRNWGVHVELWRSVVGTSRYPTDISVHDGTLEEAITSARPDIIHVHWLSFALGQSSFLAEADLPVTLRLHGFDVTPEGLAAWLANDWAKGVYAYPHQITEIGFFDQRLIPMPVAFNSTVFGPSDCKDRRLVVRASAALPSKDLDLFLEIAERLPDYRFILAAVTCHLHESYANELASRQERSRAEIRLDVPRSEISALMGEAAIYLHTMHPPDHDAGTPVGQPSSIVEAMATGCYCLVRDVSPLAELVGDAGATYRDIDELAELIRATEAWTEEKWREIRHRAIQRAWLSHADTMVFRRLFEDWMALTAEPSLVGMPAEG